MVLFSAFSPVSISTRGHFVATLLPCNNHLTWSIWRVWTGGLLPNSLLPIWAHYPLILFRTSPFSPLNILLFSIWFDLFSNSKSAGSKAGISIISSETARHSLYSLSIGIIPIFRLLALHIIVIFITRNTLMSVMKIWKRLQIIQITWSVPGCSSSNTSLPSRRRTADTVRQRAGRRGRSPTTAGPGRRKWSRTAGII